tara:strand:+ start:246 stop:473 length:228 start_codon:yes stop_codon:yes gene_type:complete
VKKFLKLNRRSKNSYIEVQSKNKGIKMKNLSYVFYGLGLIDVVSANFFGADFTGVVWSPIAFFGVGYCIDHFMGE